MKRLLHGGCRVLLVIFLGLSTSIPSTPAHAIDPNRCTTADLERMGDDAANGINDQIAEIQKRISQAQQDEQGAAAALRQAEVNLAKAQAAVQEARANWDGLNFGPKRRAINDAIDLRNHAEWQKNQLAQKLAWIREGIRGLQQELERLKRALQRIVVGFGHLIANPNNNSRSTIYDTACKLKRLNDASDYPSIIDPVLNPPKGPRGMWRRLLPDSGAEGRSNEATEYYNRSRSKWASCWNAIAAVGGAIISLWPSDSAQAGEFNDAPVNYPIRRGPYMPGDGDRGGPGAPLCPPEDPPVCAPSPYECPEEPQPPVVATATATATPAGGSSSSSSSSSSSQGTVE